MTTAQIEAGDLHASLADRTISGLLLPFGETGRTNVGRVSVARGAITVPADPSVCTLNRDHLRSDPVGRAVDLHAAADGIHGSFLVAATPEGDDLLAEVQAGRRRKLSAEVTDLVVRAGQIVSGRLYGAAAVAAGAFPSAGLLAADVGDLPDEVGVPAASETTSTEDIVVDGVTYRRVTTSRYTTEIDVVDGAPTPAESTEDEDTTESTEDEDTTEKENLMAHAAAPAGLAPRSARGLTIATTSDLFASIATAHRERNSDLMAALADITSSSHTPNVSVPQFVGELWDATAYERQYIPLFNHAELTSWSVAGWRWLVKPEVAKYAGDKAAVPSNTPTTEPVTIEAERIAGAHDIDRKFKDFGDVGFIESYYRAMTESYAEVSDVDVLDQVLAALTPIAVGTVPAGVPAGLAGVIRGYMAVLRATRRRPTFALVSDDIFEEVLFTSTNDTLPYLEKILGLPGGFGDEFLRPTVDLAADQVLVGVKDAVTVHELGGGAPIRVEALDIANGGVDHGVFGYTAVNIHRESGLALVDTEV